MNLIRVFNMKKYLFFLLSVFLILLTALASAKECPPGYEWQRMSGVGCVQSDCNDIPDAHYSYTRSCVCGSSGSINENPEDPNKECRRSNDYESCPGCVYACVHSDEDCPGEVSGPDIGAPEIFDEPEDEPESVYDEDVQEEDENPIADFFDDSGITDFFDDLGLAVEDAVFEEEYEEEELDELDDNACNKREYAKAYPMKKGESIILCSCKPGFKRTDNGCELSTDLKLSSADKQKLVTTFENLGVNQGKIIELTVDGKKVKLGVLRRSDQSLDFTTDGKEWDPDLKRLLDPSLLQSVSSGVGNFFDAINPVNWFHTSYTDKEKEKKWEVSKTVLDAYKKDLEKPKHFWQHVDEWYKWSEDKVDAAKKLKEAGILPGTWDVTKGKITGSISSYAEGFPAEAVKKFASELQTDDFAQAYSIYYQYRKTKSPQEIAKDPPVELELAISIGTASSMGDILLYQKYEEAYQRQLLREGM